VYVLVFDGGSQGNPGPAYGSFRFGPKRGKLGNPQRLDLGQGTNNEAEYATLIAGLQAVLAYLRGRKTRPSTVTLEIRGDSQLVIRQVEGAWSARDARMRDFRDEARSLLGAFAAVRYTHQPRSRSVSLLGH